MALWAFLVFKEGCQKDAIYPHFLAYSLNTEVDFIFQVNFYLPYTCGNYNNKRFVCTVAFKKLPTTDFQLRQLQGCGSFSMLPHLLSFLSVAIALSTCEEG